MREIIDMLRPGDIKLSPGRWGKFSERMAGWEDLLMPDIEAKASHKAARPGDLDTSFANNGFLTEAARGVGFPTGNGKHWILTEPQRTGMARIKVQRLLEDGAPDESFPPEGKIVDLSLSGRVEVLKAGVQSDGSLIIGGMLLSPGAGTPIVVRMTSEGDLDTSFGNAGIALIHFKEKLDANTFYDFAIQPDDRIVVALFVLIDYFVWDEEPRVVRLTRQGQLDTEFGKGGMVSGLPKHVAFLKIAVLKDDKLFLAGDSAKSGHAVLARLNADGGVDTSFGSKGYVMLRHPDYSGMRANAIALSDRDDSVVVGGPLYTAHRSFGWIARIRADGSLDDEFNDGKMFVFDGVIFTLATQDDKIILHGPWQDGLDSFLYMARLDRHGSLDTTFGHGGGMIVARPVLNPNSPFLSSSFVQGQERKTLLLSDQVILWEPNVGHTVMTQLVRVILT
ncbi:hypothetical protein [Luteibacter sp. UNCMF366Tsu5.1]|uniref:hypothetical protein n=1 Tax=Luteibacter sp. UNCMF366Tsu5.1 TaxID=1502758 RepID=UPI000908AB0A|nr:hypothetical protein [Luteibacter sp. UNCMF366Tsu5.1]SFW30332.1 delta-60 repeat domain-containing protein [Luteibacter sp. UNCMF366Tsu5.1]